MRRALVARALARLLPTDVRQEMFEPALLDLYGEAARTGRGTTLATLLLFLECWRLAPAGIIHMLLHDIRHALRLLVREPGFTIAAVLTLALGADRRSTRAPSTTCGASTASNRPARR